MLRSTLIDEIGYLTLKPEQANAFFRLMDERYNRVSTIITTNLDLPEWYELFQKKVPGRRAARPPAASLHHDPHRWPVAAKPGSAAGRRGIEPPAAPGRHSQAAHRRHAMTPSSTPRPRRCGAAAPVHRRAPP